LGTILEIKLETVKDRNLTFNSIAFITVFHFDSTVYISKIATRKKLRLQIDPFLFMHVHYIWAN